LNQAAILSAVRSLLLVAGGYAVGEGVISEPAMQEVVGAILILVTAAWGYVEKLPKKEPQ
jgi:hypothetical protein